MDNYKKLYFYLFNRLTDLSKEIAIVQNTVEEMFLTIQDSESTKNETESEDK